MEGRLVEMADCGVGNLPLGSGRPRSSVIPRLGGLHGIDFRKEVPGQMLSCPPPWRAHGLKEDQGLPRGGSRFYATFRRPD